MANSIPWTPDGYRERAADRHRDPGYRFSAERLRAARLAAGMSREAVALAIRCAGQSVYLWETGRRLPRLDRIERIARVLEIDPGDLFDPPDEPEPPAAA